MTTTDKATMYAQIEKHGQNLIKMFNLPRDTDALKLCKKLRTLENKAHALTLAHCNGSKDPHVEICKILTKVKSILFPETYTSERELFLAVFVNMDARGYALKIQDSQVREYRNLTGNNIYTDFGGYGIIAPDFTND